MQEAPGAQGDAVQDRQGVAVRPGCAFRNFFATHVSYIVRCIVDMRPVLLLTWVSQRALLFGITMQFPAADGVKLWKGSDAGV